MKIYHVSSGPSAAKRNLANSSVCPQTSAIALQYVTDVTSANSFQIGPKDLIEMWRRDNEEPRIQREATAHDAEQLIFLYGNIGYY